MGVASKFGKKEVVIIAEDISGHVWSSTEDYENQHGGYGSKINLGWGFWSFVQPLVCKWKIYRKKRKSVVAYEARPSKTWVDCCLVRKDQVKFVKGMKPWPSVKWPEGRHQEKVLIKRNIWKLPVRSKGAVRLMCLWQVIKKTGFVDGQKEVKNRGGVLLIVLVKIVNFRVIGNSETQMKKKYVEVKTKARS